MHLKKLKKVISVLMCAMLAIPSINAHAAQTISDNATGTQGGYSYELWKDYGNTSMTLNDGGTFSCQWNNIGNALFRKGIKYDSTKTYQQLGNLVCDYGCEYNPSGNSYLCIYGWTKSPLVEYYIVDSWGSWRPPGANSKGQVTIDGGTYDIYETTRVNQPSIEGNTTFQQYWSVRTSKRTSGTISITDHFKAWESKGMRMGNMYEVALTVEGYQSSGSANVYKNNIGVGTGGGNQGGGGNTGGGDNPSAPTSRSAFTTIEAEDYNSANSTTIQKIGTGGNGNGIGYIENGNSITFKNVDFGNGATSVSARVATSNATSIEFHRDSAAGPLIGTLQVGSTGDWDSYQNMTTTIANASGVHDLVLVFSGAVNVDSFVFTGSAGGNTGGGGTTNPSGKSAFSTIEAEDYNSSNSTTIQKIGTGGNGSGIGYIENGNTVTFKNIDFGTAANSVSARVATNNSTSIQFRRDSATGQLLGTMQVNSTGGWDNYQNVTATISNASGVHDLVLVFSGPVNVDSFVFAGTAGGNTGGGNTGGGGTQPSGNNAFGKIEAENFDSTNASSSLQKVDTPNGGSQSAIGYIENGNTVTYRNVNFGDGANTFKACVATESNTSIQIRTGSASGQLVGTLQVNSTGGWNNYRELSTNINAVSGVKDLVLVFSGAVNVDWFSFGSGSTGGNTGGNPGGNPDYTGKKLVALTFDDGPNTQTTPQILDKLEQYGVVASFFLIGQNINDGVKQVMQRQVNMGCELNNHSYTHSYMNSMSSYSISDEINRTNSLIQSITGQTPKFFRPPYISTSQTMYQTINMPFICGIMCDDWENGVSAQQRAQTVINNVRDGSIILMHDFSGNYNTVQALDTIIPWLKNNGYELVTVSKLFELKGVNPNVSGKIWSNVLQ